ncbi:hypothetical protein MY04_2557 [Flammeovirga sp. MY04]|uniref:DUF5700 domain-containing putative Zn-dependent protease n=1 Tax=Flammeovirga sp. MY04 TaxID=1191459 RepID=UPI00080607F6|nr:DUF5700 domain-containing putative Zn-dependent protease [Flammeovirga sp. MY04]ANQ49926.1 hypothetical protein MY04_2557 [Flammeovirga sp. MY04]
MRYYLQIIVCILFISCSTKPKKQTQIDFTTVDSFFIVKEKLQKEELPSEEEWDQLFNSTGYKVAGRDQSREGYIKLIKLAYYPPSQSEKDSILQFTLKEDLSNMQDYFLKITVENFIKVGEMEKELLTYREQYDFDQKIDAAKEKLKDFLIDPTDSLITVPSISAAIFEPEAYAYPSGIVIDLNKSFQDSDEELIGFFSHELYHMYRSKFGNKEYANHNGFTRAIEKLHNEGVADLIDKQDTVFDSKLYPKQFTDIYGEAFNSTSQTLEQFDVLTCKFVKGEISEEEYNSTTQNMFVFGGHPNGFSMTRSIVKNGQKEALVTNFANSLVFIRLYNEAAKVQGKYVFSDELMTYVDQLEDQFFENKNM